MGGGGGGREGGGGRREGWEKEGGRVDDGAVEGAGGGGGAGAGAGILQQRREIVNFRSFIMYYALAPARGCERPVQMFVGA